MTSTSKSYSWASQDIRAAIKNGKIQVTNFNEDNIQPSSFDPVIGNELYIIDTEYHGLFRVARNETVYENLISLPSNQRQRVDITNGYELKTGFSYLIPLQEELTLENDQHVLSSPKSSVGRIFMNTRMLADYNPSINEINSVFCNGYKIKMWLYVQPLAFNVIVYPRITLNQLRFYSGYEVILPLNKLIKRLDKDPILFTRNGDNKDVPTDSIVTDGLTIHLNLSGSTTSDIVGLRARHNPNPIDLSLKSYYEIEEYFEPIQKQNNMFIKRGEYYLLSSKEILKIPADLSAVLRDYSHVGFLGPLHFAGFIDNGFHGDLVYEVRSDELSKELELFHNMPISKLDVHISHIPDKLYGEANNNYQSQIGTKPAKYFKPIDYKYLGRKYDSLNKKVLSVDRNILINYRKSLEGFEKITSQAGKKLFEDLKNGTFRTRHSSENDDLVLQINAYVALVNKKGEIIAYQRGSDIMHYPEARLFGKWTIGIGCHFAEEDSPDFIPNSIYREFEEKGIKVGKYLSKPKLLGTIMSSQKFVDKLHFGIVYKIEVDEVKFNDKKFAPNCIVINKKNASFDKLKEFGLDDKDKWGTWGKLLMENINQILLK